MQRQLGPSLRRASARRALRCTSRRCPSARTFTDGSLASPEAQSDCSGPARTARARAWSSGPAAAAARVRAHPAAQGGQLSRLGSALRRALSVSPGPSVASALASRDEVDSDGPVDSDE
eukprot:9878369-Alexandrium_andersonii.AAC.1